MSESDQSGRSPRPRPPRPRTSAPAGGATGRETKGAGAGSGAAGGAGDAEQQAMRKATRERLARARDKSTGTDRPTASSRTPRASATTRSARTRQPRSNAHDRSSTRRTSPASAGTERAGVHFGGVDVSMRALGFILLVALIGVLLLPSLYDWARQEQDYRAIQQRVAAAEDRNADMRRELEMWQDPEYVASQARSRLGYLKPGETQYSVVNPGDEAQSSELSGVQDQGPKRPWLQVIAESVTEADHPDD